MDLLKGWSVDAPAALLQAPEQIGTGPFGLAVFVDPAMPGTWELREPDTGAVLARG